MSSSSSASGSASASGSGSSAQASPQPHVAGSSHPGHGPRFYRRYRSGRRVVTSHSASEGQHEATPAGPSGSAPELRRTRQRSSTMSELLEALCRVLASQRRPRSPLAGGAHRAGVTYHPRVPMDHMYYNSSFHPQQVPEPAEPDIPSRDEAMPEIAPQPSSASSSSSLRSSESAFPA